MEKVLGALILGAWAAMFPCTPASVVGQSATYLPVRLRKPVGDTASFTCRFFKVNAADDCQWYRVYFNGQWKKIASFKEQSAGRADKYNITRLDLQTFEMKILNLEKNDSGTYYCGLISFSSNQTLTATNRANLTVTEKFNTSSESETGEEKKEGSERAGSHQVPVAAIGGAGLISVFVFFGYLLSQGISRRPGHQKPPAENASLEEEPSALTVFTVDYGMLEFSASENPRRPPMRCPSNQTEYATIVFPKARPSADDTDKRTVCPDRTQLP